MDTQGPQNTDKLTKNRKALIISLLIVLAGLAGAAFVVTKAYLNPEKISAQVTRKFRDTLGRRFSFKGLEVKSYHEVLFRDVAIGERAAFGGGDFLRAEQVSVETNLSGFITGEIKIENMALLNTSMTLKRNAAKEWNYADFLNLKGGKTKLSRVSVKNGILALEDEPNGTKLLFTGINGGFNMENPANAELNGQFSGTFYGQPLAGSAEVFEETAYENKRAVSVEGKVKITDLASKNIEAGSAFFSWKFADLDKPFASRALEAELEAKNVLLLGLARAPRGEWAYWAALPFLTLSSIQGAKLPDMNRLAMDSLVFKFRQRDGVWENLEFHADGPKADLDFEGYVECLNRKGDFEIGIKMAETKFGLSLWGDLDKPEFKPEVSDYMSNGVRKSLAEFKRFLESKYP